MAPQETSWQYFVDTMKVLHEVIQRLSLIEDEDELLRNAILEAQEHLFLDRVGILMLDKKNNEIVGTWGTDDKGQLKDEHDFHEALPDSPWVEETLSNKKHVAIWQDKDLLNYGKVVGRGWNAMAAMWDSENCIGWITCDNLIKQRPIQPWLTEIIGQYGRSLGHLIIRRKHNSEIKLTNQNLEKTARQRTIELNKKIEELRKTHDDLMESEKLASLGALVAGIAHEVNTPIGVGVMAASNILDETKAIQKLFESQNIKKSDLEKYFEHSQECGELILNNLTRAGELISSFKKIASEQIYDSIEVLNLHLVMKNVSLSLAHLIKNRSIKIINDIDPDLSFKGHPGKLTQIFTNLVTNAVSHGFKNQFDMEHEGIIRVSAEEKENSIAICFADTGVGVEDDLLPIIFDRFYTTRRKEGGTGLGLDIVKTIIAKMNGEIIAEQNSPHGLKLNIRIPFEK